ncbi:MAG: Cell division protein FtsN [Syntrophus sp. SKADARSKE-3]|nr:Cell division protein FtsN [Syntrophus sp. SKADARSKE-3]
MAAKNLHQFEFKLGKLGVILLIAGMSVLVFAGFLLGVQVGRNIDTYPEMIAQGIPAKMLRAVGLTPQPLRPEVSTVETSDAPAGDGQSVKANEGGAPAVISPAPPASPAPAAESGKKEGDGSPATSAPAAQTTPVAPLAPSAAAKAVVPDVSVAAPAEAKKDKAAPTAKTGSEKDIKPAAAKEAKPPEKNGKYTVQVVSFREKEKADALGKKIVALGYKPQVSLVAISGKGQWYRVVVGGFETKDAADKAVDALTNKIKGVSCVVKGK